MNVVQAFPATWVSMPARRLLVRAGLGRVVGTPGRSILVAVGAEDLVFVHPGDRPASPCAIGVTPAGEWEPWLAAVAPGARVEISSARLAFPESGACVDLGRAAPWDPRVSGLDADGGLGLPVLADALATRSGDGIVAAVMSREGGAEPTPLARRARAAIVRLQRAVEASSPPRLCDAAADLVGLGPGLTPSGDDFLVGFLGTLRLSGARGAALVEAVAAPLLALAGERTTLVGLSFLRHALRGEFAAPVQAVLQSLGPAASTPRLARVAAELLSWGHTSGVDTLAGIVSALRSAGRFPALEPATPSFHLCALLGLRGEHFPGPTP